MILVRWSPLPSPSSSVGVHHVDLVVAVPVAREGDPPAVRGEGRSGIPRRVVGEAHLVRAVGVHHVDVVVAVPVAREGDPRPVGGEGGLELVFAAGGGEPGQVVAVAVPVVVRGVHHVELVVDRGALGIPAAGEGDAGAVGGEGGQGVDRVVARQPRLPRAVGAHDVDFAGARGIARGPGEGDLAVLPREGSGGGVRRDEQDQRHRRGHRRQRRQSTGSGGGHRHASPC